MTEVTGERSDLYVIESCRGEMLPVKAGDQVIGALGHRAATLEGVGSFLDVQKGEMHALTGAGLMGRFTSYSRYCCRLHSPSTIAATSCATAPRSR